MSFAHSADIREGAARRGPRGPDVGSGGEVASHPHGVALSRRASGHRLYPAIDPVAAEDATAWIAILKTIDELARAHDPRIVRVDANVRATDTTVLIAEADGLLAGDVRPMTILSMGGDRRSGRPARAVRLRVGSARGAGRLSGEKRSRRWSRPPSPMSLNNLDAIPAPVERDAGRAGTRLSGRTVP
ncbi:hypothetical protein ACRAWD_22265 [Caulobacter segnis]